MRDRLELGPLDAVDPRSAPRRLDLLDPPLIRRAQWVAGALSGAVLVWSVALAQGWVRVAGSTIVTGPPPSDAEHLLWIVPALFAVHCLAMAVRGVRVVLDADRLAVFGLWPLAAYRTFDLAGLRAAAFGLSQTDAGERAFRVVFTFPDARIVLHLRDRRVWEALRVRFRDRTQR